MQCAYTKSGYFSLLSPYLLLSRNRPPNVVCALRRVEWETESAPTLLVYSHSVALSFSSATLTNNLPVFFSGPGFAFASLFVSEDVCLILFLHTHSCACSAATLLSPLMACSRKIIIPFYQYLILSLCLSAHLSAHSTLTQSRALMQPTNICSHVPPPFSFSSVILSITLLLCQ